MIKQCKRTSHSMSKLIALNRITLSTTSMRTRYIEVAPKPLIQTTKQIEERLKQYQITNPNSIFAFEKHVQRPNLTQKAVSLLRSKLEDVEANKPHHVGTEKYGVYLTGPFGSGKSTLLDEIADQCLEEGWAVIRFPELSKWTLKEFSSPSDACKFFIYYMKNQYSSGRKFHKTDPLPKWWNEIFNNKQKLDEATVVKQFFKELEKYEDHRVLIVCDDFHCLYNDYPIPRAGVVSDNYVGTYPYIELIFPITRFKRSVVLLAGEPTSDGLKNSVVAGRDKFSFISVGKLEDHEWSELFASNQQAANLLFIKDNEQRLQHLTSGLVGDVVNIGDKIIRKQNESVPLPGIMKNIFAKMSQQQIGSYWFEPNAELVTTILQQYEQEQYDRFTTILNELLYSEFPDHNLTSVRSFWAAQNEYMRFKSKFFENLFTYLVPLYNPDVLVKEITRRTEGEHEVPEYKLFKNSVLEKILLKGGFIFMNSKGDYEARNPIAYRVMFKTLANSLHRLKYNYNSQRTHDLSYMDSPKEMYTRKKGALIRELARRIVELEADPETYAKTDLLKQLHTEVKASTNFKNDVVTLTPVKRGTRPMDKEQYAFLTEEQQEQRDKNIAALIFGEEVNEDSDDAEKPAQAVPDKEKFEAFQRKFNGQIPANIFEDAENIPIIVNEPNPLTNISARSLNREKRVKINILSKHKDDFKPREKVTTPVTVYKLKNEETVTSYLKTIPESDNNLLDVQLIVPYSTRTKGDIDLIVATRKNAPGNKWAAVFFKVINLEETTESLTKKTVRISDKNHLDVALSTNGQDIYEKGNLVLLCFEEKPLSSEFTIASLVHVNVISPNANMNNVWLSYIEDYMKDDMENIKSYFPEASRRRKSMIERYNKSVARDFVVEAPEETFVEDAMQRIGDKKKLQEFYDL
jgi:hypothetical protein